ncbi:MAG: MBL fold metallo-hydrolase [Candidatus Marsarchaeota archaeon]|nr:MBL fold metallo-hydrolase [Candidatus Marsarchaeota archaeon]
MRVEGRFLGGALEVGKQGILLSSDGTDILLDYGSTVSEREPKFPEHIKPSDIDAVVLSHAHLDHSGALPYMYVSDGPVVYATSATIDLSRLLLRDFLNISGDFLPYEFLEVQKMTDKARMVDYRQVVSTEKYSLEFRNAGHIPGSMMTTIELGGKSVLFTGDFNIGNTRLLIGADTGFGDVDAVIMEATYADKDHPDREDMERALVQSCKEVVEGGGTVLVPAFSVGRSHEVISVLRERGFDKEIFIDGMARKAAEIISDHPSFLRDAKLFRKSMESVTWIDGWKDRRKAVETPGVIVSPAGMLRGGAAAYYIEKVAFSRKNGIFVVSYQAEHTPGRMLVEQGKLPWKGKQRKVEARVERFDFSSHSGKTQLRDFIRGLKGSPAVYLMHGEANSLKSFAIEATEATGITVKALGNGEGFEV